MSDYAPPIADIEFVLDEILELAALAKLPAFEHPIPNSFAACWPRPAGSQPK
jgi:hypothetical protein